MPTDSKLESEPQIRCDDLLACPFCGGMASLDDLKVLPWAKREYKAKCVVCETYAPGEWTKDKAIAVAQWNTRHANSKMSGTE